MIGQTIAHYRIIEKLGAGGMGEVYLADDTKLERRVALKLLSPTLRSDPDARARLLREAKTASRLNHPNILTIYAVEEADGYDFIVMEYLQGVQLSAWARESARSEKDIVGMLAQVASGLSRAHEAGIVHRDLKPDNIIVDTDGRPKILDFGLALLSGSARLTKEQITVGTAHYMSPEQVRGEDLDGRSDIWSFGAILYEMLAGEVPFPGEASHAVMYSVLHEEPAPLKTKRTACPPVLVDIVTRCLAKDRQLRYPNGYSLLGELQSFLSGIHTANALADPRTESRPSVAILPFANMSADPDAEYFSDGLAEEIINALTKFKELRVAARTSSFSFKGKNVDVKEIGTKLGVENILEGSVRRAGDRLRIMAQLINVSDGYHLWSERFERRLDDVFAIQDEITVAIVERLTGELLSGRLPMATTHRPDNPEAHNHYLKGIYFLNQRTPESFKRAIEHFTGAVTLYPDYALAHAGLSHSYSFAAHPAWALLSPDEVITHAKKHAQEAIRLDDSLPQGWIAMGFALSMLEWNWTEADRCLKRAIKLAPELSLAHHTYSDHLMFMGLLDEAVEAQRKAIALDPLSSIVRLNLSTRLGWAGRLNEARAVIEDVISSDPSYIAAYVIRALISWASGRFADVTPDIVRTAFLRDSCPGWILVAIGGDDANQRQREALRLLRECDPTVRPTPPGVIAMLHLQAGNKELAFDWLEKTFERRDPTLMVFHRLPIFDPIRDNPRFISVMNRIAALRPPRESSATP